MADVRTLLLERARKIRGQEYRGPEIPVWDKPMRQYGPPPPPDYGQPPPPQPQTVQEMMQIPEDWDYKNPLNNAGPNGEVLPRGAIGWTPHGTPYYGDGLQGWVNGFTNRINAPAEKGIELIPKEGTFWQKTLGTFQNFGKWFYNVGGEEGGALSPLTYATRAVSEMVGGTLSGLGEFAKKTEQTFGVVKELERMIKPPAPSEPPANLPSGWIGDYVRRNYEHILPTQISMGLAYTGADQRPEDFDFEAVKTAAERGYQAGRIFYTGVMQSQIYEDYKRRLENGENPYLLAMELENPLAEFIGQVVLDPLNFIGGGIRHAKDVRRIASISDEFLKISDDIADVLRATDKVGDESKAVAAIQDLVKATQASLKKFGEDRSLFSLTADGKRYVVGRRTGELVDWMFRNDPEHALDSLVGMVRMASDDADEVAKGLSAVKNFLEPRPLFSKAGQEASVILRKMLTDETGVVNADKFIKQLEKAKGSTDDLIRFVDSKMKSVIDTTFPSVTERLAAGEKLPWTIKNLNRFNNFAQKSTYRPINTFFAGIYMGLSPGYAFRNLFTNTIHVLVDGGPGALYYKPSTLLGRTKSWLGGALPGSWGGFSGGTMGVETMEVGAKVAREAGVTTGAVRRLPAARAAERFEEWGAAQIVGKSVEDTMRKMLQPGKALPDVKPLIDAGMSPEAARLLMHKVVENFGDVKKAAAEVRAMAKTGSIDAFKTLAWLNPRDRQALAGFNISDQVMDALRGAESQEDAISKIKDIFKAMYDDAGRVADEVPMVAETNEMGHVVQALGEANAAGNISDELVGTITNVLEANSQSNGAFRRAVMMAEREANLNAARSQQDFAVLDQLFNKFRNFIDGSTEQVFRNNSWNFTKETWNWDAEIKAARTQDEFKSLWRLIGIEGEPPADLTKKVLNKSLWEKYFYPKAREASHLFREEYAKTAEGILDEIAKVIPFEREGTAVKQARNQLDIARQWDNFLMDNEILGDLRVAVKKGDNALIARIYAKQFGIASVTQKGVPLDRMLLNIINANLPEGRAAFATLANVTPDVGRQALLRHATKGLYGDEGLKIVDDAARMVAEAAPPPVAAEAAPAAAIKVSEGIDRAIVDNAVSKLPPKIRQNLDFIDDVRLGGVPEGEEGKFIVTKMDKGIIRLEKVEDKIINHEIIHGWIVSSRDEKFFSEYARIKFSAKTSSEYLENIARTGGKAPANLPFQENLARDLERYIYNREELGDDLIRLFDDNLGAVAEAAPAAALVPPPPPYAGNTPTLARVLTEQMDGIRQLETRITNGIADNWGKTEDLILNEGLTTALKDWEKEAAQKIAQARLIATKVADGARDFTMLTYPEKTYFDLALAYIYPYHFWYTRTYANWMKRIVTNPEVIAFYSKYREYLAKVHAGAPDWWKYTINTNELLGIDSENPLFFNLEQTLNPLNGLTGVDFNDPRKRINWFTATLDDLSKFGPSTWTPFSLATAVALYFKGEEEAASRWGGRLFPQTASIKALTHILNIGPPGGLELDPAVQFFSRGIDPYERARVGRALKAMVEEGVIDEATAIDAAKTQEGPVWEEGQKWAANGRAWGQMSSFLFGTGFKARSVSDMQIDRFYREYFNMWQREPGMSPDEFREAMDTLRSKYPFMDVVLLSRKGGLARDRGYAYNVLGRIPPGQKNQIAEAVGLDPELISTFYDSKGRLEDWAPTDRERFMAAVVDIGALINIPDDATKAEWGEASKRYKTLAPRLEEQFGADITQLIDQYFALGENFDGKDSFITEHPEVERALQLQDAMIINDPVLSKYYLSIKDIERYYNGNMWNAIEQQLGADIWDKWDAYNEAKLIGKADASAYWKAHPELEEYMNMKAAYKAIVAKEIVDVQALLQETPLPFLRPGVSPESLGQRGLTEALQVAEDQGVYGYSWLDWSDLLSPNLSNLVLDDVYGGESMPDVAIGQIEYIANGLGIDYNTMMELMRKSLEEQ